MTLLPDEDVTPDPDPDVDTDTNTPLLGVVQPVLPPEQATAAMRDAAQWVNDELERLRRQRADRDRDGLAEIEAMRRRLIEDRTTTNAKIKALVAEQARLARVLRVLDQ